MNSSRIELLDELLNASYEALLRTKEKDRTMGQVAADVFEAQSYLRAARIKLNEWRHQNATDPAA